MTRKKLKTLIFILVILLFFGINNGFAIPLWQFGVEDQSHSEYLQVVDHGMFAETVSFNIGNVSTLNPVQLSSPSLPGYLYDKPPFEEFEWVDTFAVGELSFDFILEKDYIQLDLIFGRFGSEIDYIYIDGIQVGTVDGTAEGHWDLFEVAILAGEDLKLNAGEHTLSVGYGGGDLDNGHYIDFIRLENGIPADGTGAASVPEPATLFLLCTGMVCAGIFRRKIGRKS